MALGRLTVPTPAHPSSFWIPFVLDHQGRRFGKYPPGWPLVLALGVLVKTPWLVNPVLAALALYLVYHLGRTLYDPTTGLLAAALGLTSPLFLVLSGSYLSHLVTLVWLLIFTLWFVWTAQGRSRLFGLGAGLALGMAFLTRSLTAAAYCAPFALYGLLQVVRRRQPHWPHYLLVALGTLAIAALLPLYQWAVTGNPWLNPYLLWWPYDRVGFGPDIGAMPGGHSPHYAWINLKQDLSRAATDVLGWPALSWLPLLLGVLLRPRRLKDWGLLAPFGCLVIAYLFYWIGSPSRLWGPRYYFEGFGGLWVLGAVGLRKVWSWSAVGAEGKAERKPRWLRPVLAATLVLILGLNLAANLPSRMQQAHGFYGISRAQLQPIEQADLHNALVIIYADRWLEYGALLAGMSPILDDDVLYARSSGDEADTALLADYPGRTIYYLVSGELLPADLAP